MSLYEKIRRVYIKDKQDSALFNKILDILYVLIIHITPTLLFAGFIAILLYHKN